MQPSVYHREPSDDGSDDDSEDDSATAQPNNHRFAAAAAWRRVATTPPQPQLKPHREEERLLPTSCLPELLVRSRSAAARTPVILYRAHIAAQSTQIACHAISSVSTVTLWPAASEARAPRAGGRQAATDIRAS